jgi:predicted RND superfamily exporter protein
LIDRRTTFVSRLTAASFANPWKIVGVAAVVAVVGAFLASHLEIRSSFAELLPSDKPSVRLVNELIRRVGGDGTVLVMIEAVDGPQDLPRAEAIAPVLARDYRALGPEVIRSVEWNLGTVERWYVDHWPMFVSLEDLRDAAARIHEEKAKAKSNALDLGLGEEDGGPEPASAADGPVTSLLDPAKPLPSDEIAARFARYRDGFMVHPDGRSITLVVRPTGTSLGVDETRGLLARMRAVADAHRAELDASHLRVAFGGTFPALLVEYESIIRDVASTFLLVVFLVLASIYAFYRDLRSIVALGFSILVAIAITFGATWLVIGYLNTQTAFLGSIVVGNGINYGLIYLARLGQLRRRGVDLREACLSAAQDASKATLLAALATSASFGTLVLAANRGFRHFGFIGGIGMTLSWAMTFVLLPATMVLIERFKPYRAPAAPAEREVTVPRWLSSAFARPWIPVAIFTVASVASLALFVGRLPTIQETNLENLSNDVRGAPEWKRDSERANAAVGTSNAGAIALLPSAEDAERYCAVVRQRAEERHEQRLVEGCETIASVVPFHQEEKLAAVRDVVAELTEGAIEKLSPAQARRARILRAQLEAQRPMKLADAPPTLLDRFRERDGTVGRIAFVRASGNAQLEIARNMFAFASIVRNVPVAGRTWDAAGENLIFADLVADLQQEGPATTAISFGSVCLLVLLFFRRWTVSARVLLSLLVGVVLMAGTATALGFKVNIFNFIVYPITFGVAADYGANLADRTVLRRDPLVALAEVGPAVFFCSWTSLVGYGSMIFSLNRALRSFGWYAIIGEVTTILAALVLLPAISSSSRKRVAG